MAGTSCPASGGEGDSKLAEGRLKRSTVYTSCSDTVDGQGQGPAMGSPVTYESEVGGHTVPLSGSGTPHVGFLSHQPAALGPGCRRH